MKRTSTALALLFFVGVVAIAADKNARIRMTDLTAPATGRPEYNTHLDVWAPLPLLRQQGDLTVTDDITVNDDLYVLDVAHVFDDLYLHSALKFTTTTEAQEVGGWSHIYTTSGSLDIHVDSDNQNSNDYINFWGGTGNDPIVFYYTGSQFFIMAKINNGTNYFLINGSSGGTYWQCHDGYPAVILDKSGAGAGIQYKSDNDAGAAHVWEKSDGTDVMSLETVTNVAELEFHIADWKIIGPDGTTGPLVWMSEAGADYDSARSTGSPSVGTVGVSVTGDGIIYLPVRLPSRLHGGAVVLDRITVDVFGLDADDYVDQIDLEYREEGAAAWSTVFSHTDNITAAAQHQIIDGSDVTLDDTQNYRLKFTFEWTDGAPGVYSARYEGHPE